jgi:hypothetical protein
MKAAGQLFALLLALLGALPECQSFVAFAGPGEALPSEFSGMVWEKHGDWHVNGGLAAVRLGESVAPGALLTAGSGSQSHSIVILLPDGQHLLCECYEAKTCSQGFRVPAITPRPNPVAWNMFVGVRNVLLLRPPTADSAYPRLSGREAMAGNYEIVAAIDSHGNISIASALRTLPSGHYALNITRDDQQNTRQVEEPLDWAPQERVALLAVNGIGLYRVRVSDPSRRLRIAIEVLATPPTSFIAESAGLIQVRKTVLEWSRFQPGWALHDFLRAYLESRMNVLSQC